MFVVCGTLLVFLEGNDLASTTATFVALSALLTAYIAFELTRLWLRDPKLILANPVALCSFFTVLMSFGVTNFLYFLPDDYSYLLGFAPAITPAMNKMIMLAGMAGMTMWLGYWTGIGQRVCRAVLSSRGASKLLRPTYQINILTVASLLVIDVVAKFVSLKLGVFGYSSDYESLLEYGNIRAYLNFADAGGKLALVGLALAYYSKQDIPYLRSVFAGVLVYQVITGFLIGFKSQVVMPFVTVGFCAYLASGRFPRWFLWSLIGSLIAAYVVIEPFRAARYDNLSMDNTSANSVLATMLDSVGRPSTSSDTDVAHIAVSILARGNLTYIASLGVEYKDEHGSLDEAPAFLDDILWAPAYAFVPRLLWESKPVQTLGLWYYRTVMGYDGYTSVGMSPFTYLYFAGGTVAVVLGFFALGVLHGAWREALGASAGAKLVALGTLSTLVMVESSFDTVFVTLLRFVPALVLAQLLLLKPPRANTIRPVAMGRPRPLLP